ncbi:MAG: hypothetical protein NC038_07755 [Paludibacter sp.]|nr:hypothetical protein [Prevotella sp.]MCM1443637.1 hypothetical protein [Muribaculum sp.]MCM1482512.1 hypothetical protein [Paludibacter sp.]MCM1576888.1 hypothetical protein [Bacteroides sp.]
MKAQEAISMLKNRAEISVARASNYYQRQEANNLVEMTNALIQLYNENEKLEKAVQSKNKTLLLLYKFFGCNKFDREELINIDYEFIERRIKLYLMKDKHLNYFLSFGLGFFRMIFHYIKVDYHIYISSKEGIESTLSSLKIIETTLDKITNRDPHYLMNEDFHLYCKFRSSYRQFLNDHRYTVQLYETDQYKYMNIYDLIDYVL